MARALLLSLRQFGDRAILWVLAKSLALTLAVLALVGVGYWMLLDRLAAAWSMGAGGGLAAAAAIVAAALTGWLLFRVVAIAALGVFADEVVEAVERRHYPAALDRAVPIGFGRSTALGLRSAVRALLVNLLVLPLYLALLVTGVGVPLLFLLVNAWTLGRDLGDMAAVRHLSPPQMRPWRRDTRIERFVLGLGIAALLLVPVLGLLAPVLGAAMATHLFHRSRP